jgi:uncharacterized protein
MLKRICSNLIRKVENPLIREKFKSRIHCLENVETGIIFLKDSLSIFDCPKPLKNSLADFLSGSSRKRACEKHGNNEAQLDALLGVLYKKINAKEESVRGVSYENVLDRLVINISNDCNLKCKYCYAGGGTYGGSKAFMDEKTAITVLDTFFAAFDTISKIQFFGGEPLLNTPIIAFICEEASRRYKNGLIENLPSFSIVTNGTLRSPEIFDMFKKYQISPTVSLDGPEHIHNYLRGSGTFQKTCQFLQDLEDNGIQFGFESTYTAYHLREGVTLVEMLNFFYHEFHQQEVHIPEVSLSKNHPLAIDDKLAAKVYREAIEYSIDSLKDGKSASLSFATRILNAYLEEEPIENYCPAGISTLSVDIEGYVYPCFMFTGVKDFQLGNVHRKQFLEGERVKRIRKIISASYKRNNPKCRKCWASPLCFGCVGADYIRNGGDLEKTDCNVMKSMVEGFLSKALVINNSAAPQTDNAQLQKEVIYEIRDKEKVK